MDGRAKELHDSKGYLMILFKDGQRFSLQRYANEEEFERDIFINSKELFGSSTVLIEAKKRIDSKALGGAIPDAFLFDISDPDNPEFYLIEAELSSHDFYRHIFPQVTKFFAFFRNTESRKELTEKIYSLVTMETNLQRVFKKLSGQSEVYKYISDTIENSQNILLVIDGEKKELPEIMDTYTDTWGKTVKVQMLQKYVCNSQVIYLMDPEFERVEFSLAATAEETETPTEISEEFHLEGVSENVKEIYYSLKQRLLAINEELLFNPPKYYISLKNKRNVVFCKIRKKKLRLIVMLPLETIRERIRHHPVKELSEPVQTFYNGPCAAVDIEDLQDVEEVVELVKPLATKQNEE